MYPAVTDLIPHRPPFLFLDTITEVGTDVLVAHRTWRAEEDFYRGHYPGAPITPGVLLCEAVFQAGAAFLSLEARTSGAALGEGMPLLAKVKDVRFRNPVYPGDVVRIEVKKRESMGGFTMMSGAITKAGQRILSVDFAVAWKVPEGGAHA